jgi:F-type H+-transporting ATPase subunit delta
MLNPKLAARYAKSLIDLALETNQLEAIYADVLLVQQACKSNPELLRLLKSPIIKADKKLSILKAVFADKTTAITSMFLSLLVVKGRENLIDEVVNAFADQYRDIKGIFKVRLTTAAPVGANLQALLADKLKIAFPNINAIELEAKVDESLIGGYKLEAANTLIDASVAKGLNEVRKQFKGNEYIYSIQ